MGLIVLIVLVLLLFGGLPVFGYHNQGYGPSGIVGVILVFFVIFWLAGHRF